MHSTPTFGKQSVLLGSALAAGLILLAVPAARAIAPIGDDSELFVTGTVSGEYNDNIFLSHENADDDYIFDLIPGLSYEFGKNNSLTTGQLALSEDFQLFAKKSYLNNDLFNGAYWTKYDDSKTKIDFDASFHQADQAQITIQNLKYLVNRNLSHVDALGEVQLDEKSSLGAGVVWDDTDYKTIGFTDWRYWQIPIDYYFKFEPKLDLSAGFRFQDNTLGINGVDSNTYYYNIGARGEFTPNLTGKFTVGYLVSEPEIGKNQSGLGAESSFTYAYSAKTNVTFGVNDDYGYAAGGTNFRDLSVFVGASTNLTEQWSANGQLAYNRYSYTTTIERSDFYTLRLGASYIYSTNITFDGGYTFGENNSNISANSFKNNLISLAATVHY